MEGWNENINILNVARALRFQGELSIYFWSECVLALFHLINRTPSIVIDNKTLMRLSFGRVKLSSLLTATSPRGRERNTFRTILDSCIFSPSLNDSLAISRTLSLYSATDSSSDIFKASNFEVTNCNLDVLTFVVPSYATSKIFHASLAELQELINLNTFNSTPLKIALRVLAFPTKACSSASVQLTSNFGTEIPSTVIIGGSHLATSALYAFPSRVLINDIIRGF
ncbi:uncharacterized protein LOC103491923 isoform X2 [Cucumis melo]|nr:uncharacterized protein LOC103491923 isoform X2 [Cucumis melo]XP_050947450.1 uncharacterized protein LOC103491923 isoform X2 [Cucumis melo]